MLRSSGIKELNRCDFNIYDHNVIVIWSEYKDDSIPFVLDFFFWCHIFLDINLVS